MVVVMMMMKIDKHLYIIINLRCLFVTNHSVVSFIAGQKSLLVVVVVDNWILVKKYIKID